MRTVLCCVVVVQDDIMVQELRGLFLELDPLDTGCVAYTRLQQEMEVRLLACCLFVLHLGSLHGRGNQCVACTKRCDQCRPGLKGCGSRAAPGSVAQGVRGCSYLACLSECRLINCSHVFPFYYSTAGGHV